MKIAHLPTWKQLGSKKSWREKELNVCFLSCLVPGLGQGKHLRILGAPLSHVVSPCDLSSMAASGQPDSLVLLRYMYQEGNKLEASITHSPASSLPLKSQAHPDSSWVEQTPALEGGISRSQCKEVRPSLRVNPVPHEVFLTH